MSLTKLNHGLWALGMTGGILATGLLTAQHVVKATISPTLALALLALPALYFYAVSEYARASGRPSPPHQNAALALACLILASYAAPMLVTHLALPDYRPGFNHYSQHAPLALAVGLLLMRLHALTARRVLVFVGATAVMVAGFFLAVNAPKGIMGAIPPQSAGQTFEFFAWIALGFSYLFLALTRPLKRALAVMARIPDDLWRPLEIYLMTLLLIGCHGFLALSLAFHQDQRLLGFGVLLIAGIWFFAGLRFRQRLCFWCAFSGLALAISSNRVTYAWWPETWNLWLVCGLSGGLVLLYHGWFRRHDDPAEPYAQPFAWADVYAWFGLLGLLMYFEYAAAYGLGSRAGLLPLLLAWALGFWLPANGAAERAPLFAGLLVWLYLPALFVFLAQGYPALAHVPPALLTLLISSGLIVAYRAYHWRWFPDDSGAAAVYAWQHVHSALNHPQATRPVLTLLTVATLVVHAAGQMLGPQALARNLLSMTLVQGALMVYWFDLARQYRRWWATVTAELMAAGLLFSLRRGIPTVFGLPWSAEWDVLVGWGLAVSIVAAKTLLHNQDPAVRLPLRVTLFGLPILTAVYALSGRVNFEFFALVVLPLYALLFLFQAYSERDRLVLCYAVLTMNSYVLLLFSHQQFRSVQWYVTPVCLSALILVEVFRDITSAATANVVRGAALAALLGAALTQAIVTHAQSPLTHAFVLTVSSLAIAAASLLRVKIFAAFGSFAFLIDLIAIVYLVLSRQNLETLMVVLGGGLTLIGLLTIGGYYVYRQHQPPIDAYVLGWRERFASWE
jgi:hypothetical protein